MKDTGVFEGGILKMVSNINKASFWMSTKNVVFNTYWGDILSRRVTEINKTVLFKLLVASSTSIVEER